MTKDNFSKKLISLRKKNNMTQQQLAELLNVSNKTVSRWETAESYPDIELIPAIANVFHVSTDYLLQDHQDFKELDKYDIVSYLPWIMSVAGIFIYFTFVKLGVPSLFAFYIFYYIIKFSYQFFHQYTDGKHSYFFVELNTIQNFFVTQNVVLEILEFIFGLSWGMLLTDLSQFSVPNINPNDLCTIYILSFLIAGIQAYFHFKKHNSNQNKKEN